MPAPLRRPRPLRGGSAGRLPRRPRRSGRGRARRCGPRRGDSGGQGRRRGRRRFRSLSGILRRGRPGFADGAVVGNIFTSPSTADAYTVGKAVAYDGALLFTTGNYAGDVMNFTLAQQRLSAEGIDARIVFVTDDVASRRRSRIAKRRGIAGDFVVFKIAGAAADGGSASTRSSGSAGTPTTAPGPWVWRSPAARARRRPSAVRGAGRADGARPRHPR